MKNNELEVLNLLNKYELQLGIFDSEGSKKININIIDIDNIEKEIKMSVKDIMFFTEYGTIKLPGYRILEKSLFYINNIFTNDISKLTDKILENLVSEQTLEKELKDIEVKLENLIKNYINSLLNDYLRINKILNRLYSSSFFFFVVKNASEIVAIKVTKSSNST